MSRAWILIALAFGQDGSTPEQALATYLAARQKFTEETNLLIEVQKISVAAEASLSTDAFRQRRQAKLKDEEREHERRRRRNLKHRVVERKDDGDSATLVFEETSTVAEGAEEKSLQKVVCRKSDGRWLLAKEFRACRFCKGTGACDGCDGTGKIQEMECVRCKGDKTCRSCGGSKWREEDFLPRFEFGSNDAFKPRADLSTARGAAEAFADCLVVEQNRLAALIRKTYDSALRLLRENFVPSVAQAVETALQQAAEKGNAALKAHEAKVERLAEKDGAATAVVNTPPGSFGNTGRKRLALRKAADRWLIDDVEFPCWTCRGEGVCRACSGTGKSEGDACILCKGEARCATCKGEGFLGDR
jgi:hypothetical protein